MDMDKMISAFQWSSLGDLEEGRKNLGMEAPVIIYRLLLYSTKTILETEYGKERAKTLLKDAGFFAGVQFARNLLDLTGGLDYFIAHLTDKFKELKIGYLYIERADLENMTFVLTISEDLDCSGLPVTDETVCDYDEGFIAGILQTYTGIPFEVQEIDCWASGDRTCRFHAAAKKVKELK